MPVPGRMRFEVHRLGAGFGNRRCGLRHVVPDGSVVPTEMQYSAFLFQCGLNVKPQCAIRGKLETLASVALHIEIVMHYSAHRDRNWRSPNRKGSLVHGSL